MADDLSSQFPGLRLDDDDDNADQVADAFWSGAYAHEVSSSEGSAASNHENGFGDYDAFVDDEDLSFSGSSAESASTQESNCEALYTSSQRCQKIPGKWIPTADDGKNKKLIEIIRDNALRHLPADNLLRLLPVSSSWARLISSPFFRHCQAYTHRSVSGVFFRLKDKPAFAPFGSASVPDAALSFLPEIVVLSSSNGLFLCYAQSSSTFFVCNPITTAFTAIPKPHVNPGSFPAAVLIFHPGSFNFRGDFSIVVANRDFWFQTFSSASGEWCISDHQSPIDWVLPASGISVGGSAFWRSTMRTVVRYDPKSDRTSNLLPPMGSESDARWEIGEMCGQLHCAVVTQMEVLVYKLVGIPNEWALVANLDWITWPQAEGTEEQVPSRCMLDLEERPWPVKFQSGDEEILLWTPGLVIAVNVKSRDIRLAEVDFGQPPADEGSEYTAHISTFAVIASSPYKPRPKSSSSEPAPPS
ncbi:hypothetical protein ZIOFF_026251 [Zingiber officinale]|uniref:Uncharacterized protein n=1 Tax=Zingiber officinale TaxID=94328 RepID=A0A8J5L7B9_ZINOF|nr:hypothetical protein ZIOFF_026251 [Zingiber officinale]